MEIIEQLIPDLAGIVFDYLGNGIFPGDLILPFDKWYYLVKEKCPFAKFNSNCSLALFDSGIRSNITIEKVIIASRFITQCVVCQFTIFGNKYLLIGDLIGFSNKFRICCDQCFDEGTEYKLIDSEQNLYMPVSCFKYDLKDKKIICNIGDKIVNYTYIDLGDKVLFVVFSESVIGHTQTKTKELGYNQLIDHINNLISMLKK